MAAKQEVVLVTSVPLRDEARQSFVAGDVVAISNGKAADTGQQLQGN